MRGHVQVLIFRWWKVCEKKLLAIKYCPLAGFLHDLLRELNAWFYCFNKRGSVQ